VNFRKRLFSNFRRIHRGRKINGRMPQQQRDQLQSGKSADTNNSNSDFLHTDNSRILPITFLPH
jgi:hypothetical protein